MTFREANEKIEATAEGLAIYEKVPFLCECADRSCTELVRLTLVEYEEVREDPRRFFNALGHERLTLEAGAGVVIDTRPGYVVVEKIGLAGEIAAADATGGTDGHG